MEKVLFEKRTYKLTQENGKNFFFTVVTSLGGKTTPDLPKEDGIFMRIATSPFEPSASSQFDTAYQLRTDITKAPAKIVEIESEIKRIVEEREKQITDLKNTLRLLQESIATELRLANVQRNEVVLCDEDLSVSYKSNELSFSINKIRRV